MIKVLSTHTLIPFGIEVNLDLNAPMASTTLAELKALFAEHHLMLFRGQNMEMTQQIRVAKRFGPVVSGDGVSLGIYISNCRPDGILGKGELCFHSDLSNTRYPTQAIFMQAIDVVDGATSTRFASGALAYSLLPEATRNRLSGLQALLVYPLDGSRRWRNKEVPPHYPRAIQPLEWTHPVTGRRFLYLDSQTTDSVLGLADKDSEALLQELWNIELAQENIYEHFWNNGDTILWDNLALLHARGDVSTVGNRTLQRVTIAEKGYADIFPEADLAEIKGKDGKNTVGSPVG